MAVVHNGIIENFAPLRDELERAGHELLSETDTEIAAHLLELAVAECDDLTEAMQITCRRLEGAFTLVAIDAQDPEPGGRGAPQLAAGGRRRRGGELPRLRRRRLHRAHP